MTRGQETLGGLASTRVATGAAAGVAVVMLHGYSMGPADLEPFARSLGVSAEFYLPAGPRDADGAGRAWWPIDQERRASALAAGPRDLFAEQPAGLAAARASLVEFLGAVRARHSELPIVLVGFSQGGMLACDAVLRGGIQADGLALLSSSRICFSDWTRNAARLRDVPVLISHGRADLDLAFQAGEALCDFCMEAGALVTWVPFEGGHEIPLVVWRHVKQFLNDRATPGARP